MPFTIVQNDIARVRADVLVNAANHWLQAGSGVCGAIFAGAGHAAMQQACDEIGGCPVGSAVTTPGFELPCTWVVHAVGPVWQGGNHGEEELLRSCYRSVFAEVARLRARSVAFPLISAGIYGYPIDQALAIVHGEVAAFLDDHDDVDVRLVVLDRSIFQQAERLFPELDAIVSQIGIPHDSFYLTGSNQVQTQLGDLELEEIDLTCDLRAPAFPTSPEAPYPDVLAKGDDASRYTASHIEVPVAPRRAPLQKPHRDSKAQAKTHPDDPSITPELIRQLSSMDAPFASKLLGLIDARGLTDAQVYKRANISRQLFAKIRSHPDYRPTKPTAVALAVALELDLPQTQDLLASAGLTLSRSSVFDVIVTFFIQRRIYDIYLINESLFSYDQPLLGSVS